MSEDIHKWSDGRYTLMFDEHTFFVFDNEKKKEMTALQTTKKLNEQQSIIHKNEISIKTMISNMKKLEEKNEQLRNYNKQLKQRLEKINGGYGHLTHRSGLTPNEWLIESQERELKKKDEQISDWIEQHSKDIVKIGEQQAIIEGLKEKLCELGVSDVKINGKRMNTGLAEWLE